MRTKNRQLTNLIYAAAVALFVTPAWAADIAGNGGFETAGPGGATDSDQWTEFGGAPVTGLSLSERDPANPASGSFSHYLVAEGTTAGGAAAGMNQNSIADVGQPSLEENTGVNVTFDYGSAYGVGGVFTANVRILNSVGAIVADSGPQALPDTGGLYQPFTVPTVTVPAFGAPPNDVYAAFVEFNLAAGAIDGQLSFADIDNVVIDATLVAAQPVPALSDISLFVMLLLFAATLGYFALRSSNRATAA